MVRCAGCDPFVSGPRWGTALFMSVAVLLLSTGCERQSASSPEKSTVAAPVKTQLTAGEVCQLPLDFLRKVWVGTRDASVLLDDGTTADRPVFSPGTSEVICYYRASKGATKDQSPMLDVKQQLDPIPPRTYQVARDWEVDGSVVSVRWHNDPNEDWRTAGVLDLVANVDGLSGLLNVPTPRAWDSPGAPAVSETDVQQVAAELVRILHRIASAR